MSKFNAETYRQFRPFYPAETFQGLKKNLVQRGFQEPFSVADIGCGTGHSAISFLRTGVTSQVIGLDLDPQMLKQARDLSKLEGFTSIEFREGQGEATGLENQSVDLVLVGSAFHWMNGESSKNEFARILKPRGCVRIFEYQFPKAQALFEVNEWIRRQFNLYWKATDQRPRGKLTELVQVFGQDPRFEFLAEGRPLMVQLLTASDLSGLIFSQSRVLCYEETLSQGEKAVFRKSVSENLNSAFAGNSHAFDFKLGWIDYALRG